jgi:hypothetical protein
MSEKKKHSFSAVLFSVGALVSISFCIPACASGTTYYINNSAGSNCSDGGAHSITEPWCSFTPLNAIGTFSPGDQILLASGSSWNQEMMLTGSGTPTEPILLSSYSKGDRPKILLGQGTGDICVLLTNPSYWNISNLEIGEASVGILLHYTQLFNNGIALSNIYVHDNKGIWGGYSRSYHVSNNTRDPFAASLNINLSSGILFNTSSNLAFSSSQYVLKGVSISDIRGTHNVDSVAFDAETGTTDQQDGHNAFQNVVLNGLFISNDDGHAGRIYQSAGLGCSDSLRLLGMMNVTILNSVLYDEAACHTGTGTAAVILGRVSNLTFVNNIIFGVPETKSHDETGIDLEWSETNVVLEANLFGGNGGAAVEILNIHQGDHTTDINFVDNTFENNSLSVHPGAASIWESRDGGGYATPTGSISNNLYTELEGKFLGGKDIGSIKSSNNKSTELMPNYAALQFSSTQAKNQWQYMYEVSESTWTNIPSFSNADYDGAWEMGPTQYVSAFNLSPASSIGSQKTGGGVARDWKAPRSGIISIRGRVLKSDGQGGSGVFATINHGSPAGVTQIWPTAGGGQLIAGGDMVGYATDVDNISVSAGDLVRFEVHANGDNAHDAVSWTPSVAYVRER